MKIKVELFMNILVQKLENVELPDQEICVLLAAINRLKSYKALPTMELLISKIKGEEEIELESDDDFEIQVRVFNLKSFF